MSLILLVRLWLLGTHLKKKKSVSSRNFLKIYCSFFLFTENRVREVEKYKMVENRFEFEMWLLGFSGGSDGEESACNAGDSGSVCGLGSSPAEGNGNPLQYSCLENSMDRGAWWAPVQSETRLNDWAHTQCSMHSFGGCFCIYVTFMHKSLWIFWIIYLASILKSYKHLYAIVWLLLRAVH